MKIGRSFTNLLYSNYLDEENKEKLMSGEMEVRDTDALVEMEAKGDIPGQIKEAEKIGIDHVELDGAIPNPYLDFSEEEKDKARKAKESSDISLSLHFPYTFVADCLCAPAERERKTASDLLKEYIEFASDIGCSYLNAHPGSVPFYQTEGKYREKVRESLKKSLVELGKFASQKDMDLHIENNVASASVFVEPEELKGVVEDVRSEGVDIYFNFDIGHWLTRADAGREIPVPPENIVKKIPKEMVKELHLNDYIPGKRIFHPPLHEQKGLLQRENVENYAEIVKEKNAELIVLETAFRTREHIKNKEEILRKETNYIEKIFG